MKNQELTNLKRQKAKLLNKECNTVKEFEVIQNKLDKVELEMNLLQNNN